MAHRAPGPIKKARKVHFPGPRDVHGPAGRGRCRRAATHVTTPGTAVRADTPSSPTSTSSTSRRAKPTACTPSVRLGGSQSSNHTHPPIAAIIGDDPDARPDFLKPASFITGPHVAWPADPAVSSTPSLFRIKREVCTDFEAELKQFNGQEDHVHLLVHHAPKVQLPKLVNSLEGVSSRYLRKEYDTHVHRYLWGGHFRSGSHFAASCGGAPLTVVRSTSRISSVPHSRLRPTVQTPAHGQVGAVSGCAAPSPKRGSTAQDQR
ncbi:IS200/IS605 family transposase [Streptomyces sp. NBC_00390]